MCRRASRGRCPPAVAFHHGLSLLPWQKAPGRMRKKSAGFILSSLRGSTYRSVRLASSLAAAALGGHFEHPAEAFLVVDIYENKGFRRLLDRLFLLPKSRMFRGMPHADPLNGDV
jgi:hypothetical protein